MPYSLRGNHPACPGWAVINTHTGQLVPGGCHPTKKKAIAHLRALYKNVGMQDLALTEQFPDAPGGTMSIGAEAGGEVMETMGSDSAEIEAESPAPHPGSAERLRIYWGFGKGAAKIRWGTPGLPETMNVVSAKW